MIRFATTLFVAAALLLTASTGCEREEEVLDVETREGEVEVDRSTETGELDVEVDDGGPLE